MVKEKTAEMTAALNKVILAQRESKANRAFRMAYSRSPEYVDSLKIGFLRAEVFNSKKAADRMVRFFENKLEYFGEDKLVKDITLDDLSEDDLETIHGGAVQILSTKDRAGRTVLFTNAKLLKYKHWKNLVRILLLLLFVSGVYMPFHGSLLISLLSPIESYHYYYQLWQRLEGTWHMDSYIFWAGYCWNRTQQDSWQRTQQDYSCWN